MTDKRSGFSNIPSLTAASKVKIALKTPVESGSKAGDIFRDVILPDGSRTRVMKKRIFDDAVDAADRKLEEILKEQNPDAA